MRKLIPRATPASGHPFGWQTRTEVALRADLILSLCVRQGDLLRSEAGTVWATIDGEWPDILLLSGQVHYVAADAALRVSGLDTARLTVIGREAPCPCQHDRTDMFAMLRAAWERLKGGLRSGSLGPVPA